MADSPRIEELKRRVQVDPASIAFAALAEEYRRAGRYEEAIATCHTGLQRHPAYLSAHVTLGRALLELGRYDEARTELEHVLRAAPENLAAIRGLAEIHHRRGDLPEALEQFKSALHVARHDTELQETVTEIPEQVSLAPPPEPGPLPDPGAAPLSAPVPREIASTPETETAPAPEPPLVVKPASLLQFAPRESAPVEPPPQPVETAWTAVPWPESEPDSDAELWGPAPASKPPVPQSVEPSPPHPALLPLESFLAAVLRAKNDLAADPHAR